MRINICLLTPQLLIIFILSILGKRKSSVKYRLRNCDIFR